MAAKIGRGTAALAVLFVEAACLFALFSAGTAGCAGMSAIAATPDALAGASGAEPSPPPPARKMCLSLRVLGREAGKAMIAGAPLPEAVRTLGGIGRLDGFVIDRESADVILVGQQMVRRPTLHMDDLVASIRNVANGDPSPCCSLDPRPEDVVKVDRLVASGLSAQETYRELQKTLGPQMVMIGGVPFNSRYARVMIDADYHMKKVSQGLATVPGVPSYIDLSIQEAKEKAGEKDASGSETSMSRFWFHVANGEPTFRKREGIVWLDKCSVTLLTEAQRASADGTLSDSGEDSPLANAFAAGFTENFAKAAAAVPEYEDIENLYRLYSLVHAIDFCDAFGQAGLDASLYRQRYRYQEEKPMPESLPGLANMKECELAVERGGIVSTLAVFPIVCGGVSMEVDVRKAPFADHAPLTGRRVAVLKARPNANALTWPFDEKDER